MTQQAITDQIKARELSVDGIGEDGTFAGDGSSRPFVVFDADHQKNIAGPFDSRTEADAAMAKIHAGGKEELDHDKLGEMLDAIDNPVRKKPSSTSKPDLREWVARAICSACEENPEHAGDARGNQFRWQDYLAAADAAIEAAASH